MNKTIAIVLPFLLAACAIQPKLVRLKTDQKDEQIKKFQQSKKESELRQEISALRKKRENQFNEMWTTNGITDHVFFSKLMQVFEERKYLDFEVGYQTFFEHYAKSTKKKDVLYLGSLNAFQLGQNPGALQRINDFLNLSPRNDPRYQQALLHKAEIYKKLKLFDFSEKTLVLILEKYAHTAEAERAQLELGLLHDRKEDIR